MGFAAGFRTGSQAVQDYRAGERRKITDAQADKRFAREETNWTREDEARAREDEAWRSFETAVPAPVLPAQGLAMPPVRAPAVVAATTDQGVNPGVRDVGSGQAASLPSGAAGVEAPAAALAPPAMSRLQREQALGRVAAARRDPNAMRQSMTAETDLQMREVVNSVSKLTDDEVAAQAKLLNTNSSNVPLLYAGKGKGGYTFLTMSPDGEPGQQFKLNIAQMRQLVTANALGQAGFGTEALTMASNTHKALNDAMSEWNKAQQTSATTNNAGTRYANSDAQDAARLAESARHNRASEGLSATRMNREDWQVVGATDDNKGMLSFNKRTGETKAMPLPPGSDAAGLFRRVTGQGGAGAAKPVPEAGTILSDGRQTFKADGMGGMLAPKAPMPDERPKILDKAGIEPGFAEALQWDRSGQYVRFGGMNYDVTKPADLAQLRADTKRLAAGTRAVEEGQLSTFREPALRRQALERADPAYFENPERPAFRYAPAR
jgi:hypothetical protein